MIMRREARRENGGFMKISRLGLLCVCESDRRRVSSYGFQDLYYCYFLKCEIKYYMCDVK